MTDQIPPNLSFASPRAKLNKNKPKNLKTKNLK